MDPLRTKRLLLLGLAALVVLACNLPGLARPTDSGASAIYTAAARTVEAQEQMKEMLATFIERLARITDSSTTYHSTVERCAELIGKATTLEEIAPVMKEVMGATRAMALDSRVTVWTGATGFSFRVRDLESGPILIPEHGAFVTKAGTGGTSPVLNLRVMPREQAPRR